MERYGKVFVGGIAQNIVENGIAVRGTRLFLFHDTDRDLNKRRRKQFDCKQDRRHTLEHAADIPLTANKANNFILYKVYLNR